MKLEGPHEHVVSTVDRTRGGIRGRGEMAASISVDPAGGRWVMGLRVRGITIYGEAIWLDLETLGEVLQGRSQLRHCELAGGSQFNL